MTPAAPTSEGPIDEKLTPLALVFDLDGTLVDSTLGIVTSLSAAFRAIGREMPGADLRAIIGPPITTMAKQIDPTLTNAELPVLERAYRAHYDSEGWRETFLYPAVDETLVSLQRRRHPLFVVTNKPRIPAQQILRHLNISPLFVEILTRDSRVPPFSTKTEMLADLLRRNRLCSTATIMVGDTAEDQHAAEANQVRFVFATFGYGTIRDTRHPIDQFRDLIPLLAANGPLN